MARLTIELQCRPGGETTYRLSLVSDDDATPREHEQAHRRAVARLLPGVDLDSESPRFRVEREQPQQEPALPCAGDDGGYEVIDLG